MVRNVTLVSLASFVLAALLCFAPTAEAKRRGCAYRLQALDEARYHLERARRGDGGVVVNAEAAHSIAESKAREEGCFSQTTRTPQPTRADQRLRGATGLQRTDRGRVEQRRRFDHLLSQGYQRGLSRQEFRELQDLRASLGQ